MTIIHIDVEDRQTLGTRTVVVEVREIAEDDHWTPVGDWAAEVDYHAPLHDVVHDALRHVLGDDR